MAKDERMLSEKRLLKARSLATGKSDPTAQITIMLLDHIAALAEQLKQANDTLVRLHDYGIDTRNFGDGDAQALWGRIDEFRGLDRDDANATLSRDDGRELAEWWADLHTIVCDLDEKLMAANEALKKAEADRNNLLCEVDTLQCDIASAFGWDMKGEKFVDAVRRTIAERDALQTQLEAWQTAFGTTRLTHAVADRDALVKRIAELALQSP